MGQDRRGVRGLGQSDGRLLGLGAGSWGSSRIVASWGREGLASGCLLSRLFFLNGVAPGGRFSKWNGRSCCEAGERYDGVCRSKISQVVISGMRTWFDIALRDMAYQRCLVTQSNKWPFPHAVNLKTLPCIEDRVDDQMLVQIEYTVSDHHLLRNAFVSDPKRQEMLLP